jgi:phosphohistidine phosphatase
MDLYIIRHAWAEQPGSRAWPSDSLRPLTDEGRERFARMVQKLVERGFAPTSIATSPMVRCVETAEIIARAVGEHVEVVQREELLPSGDAEALITWTAKQARHHKELAWVGHAPDVGRLGTAVLGKADGWLHFGKGTIAALRFEDTPWSAPGELRWLVTAKVLGC